MAINEVLLRNCVWGVRCDKVWDDLHPTSFRQVRHCGSCDTPVHFCEDEEQLRYALEQDWCVSFVADQRSDQPETIEGTGGVPSTGFIVGIRQETFSEIARLNRDFGAPPKGYSSFSWADQSPLHLLGYRVGRKGLSLPKRRRLLTAFYNVELPAEFPAPYAERWGSPRSPERRAQMVQHIRWLASQAAQRENAEAMKAAISDWEDDALFVEFSDW